MGSSCAVHALHSCLEGKQVSQVALNVKNVSIPKTFQMGRSGTGHALHSCVEGKEVSHSFLVFTFSDTNALPPGEDAFLQHAIFVN